MEGDPLNKVISLVIAAIVGIVMVVGAFLPIASSQISWAGGTHKEVVDGNTIDVANIPGINSITGGSATVTALLSIVVFMVIVGLIIGVVSYLKIKD